MQVFLNIDGAVFEFCIKLLNQPLTITTNRNAHKCSALHQKVTCSGFQYKERLTLRLLSGRLLLKILRYFREDAGRSD